MKAWMLIIPALMIIAVLPCTIHATVFLCVFRRVKRRKVDPAECSHGDKQLLRRWNDTLARLESTPHERITIRAFDGVKLAADWYPGKKGAVLLFHGYRSSPTSNCALQAADLIADGWSVLLPWQRAHGDSGGLFCGMGYLEARDILAWNDWVLREKKVAAAAILGVSMGGCALGQCAAELPPQVKAIMIDCAYDSFAEQFVAKASRYPFPLPLGFKGIAGTVSKFQHTDITQRASDRLKACDIPALFIYGEKDVEVSPEAIIRMHKAHRGEKELFIGRGAGHARSYELDGEKAREVLLSFLNTHLLEGGFEYGGEVRYTG